MFISSTGAASLGILCYIAYTSWGNGLNEYVDKSGLILLGTILKQTHSFPRSFLELAKAFQRNCYIDKWSFVKSKVFLWNGSI